MKKINAFILFAIVFIFILNTNVYAASTCTSEEKKNLKTEALNVEADYELEKPSNEPAADPTLYYYNLYVTNVSTNFKIVTGMTTYNYSDSKNGEIYIEHAYIMGGYYAYVEVYASSTTNCDGTLLKTIKLQIPYWNKYSDREECSNLKDYDICKTNINTTEITEEGFQNLIKEAEEQEKNKNKQEPEPVHKQNIFQKLLSYYLENKMISIPVTIVIILLFIVIIIKISANNKNKIKIDLGDKL